MVDLAALREHGWSEAAKAADEIERLQKRVRELEQAISQAGDSVEMQEAEQRGFERGRAYEQKAD